MIMMKTKKKQENSDILIYGNAAYFSKQNIQSIAGGRRTAVVGPDIRPQETKGIRWYKKSSEEKTFPRLFQVYDFDTVVFVSGYLTCESEPDNEIEELRRLLHQCRKYGLSRGVILLSQDLCMHENISRSMELAFMEDLCRYYSDSSMNIQIIRCPFFADPLVEQDYFRDLFEALEEGREWTFSRPASEKTNFISSKDMQTFLGRLLDQTPDKSFEQLDLRGYQKYTFGQVTEIIRRQYPLCVIRCSDQKQPDAPTYGENKIQRRLGWFATEDVFDHFGEMAVAYRQHPRVKKTRREILLEHFRGWEWLLTAAELAVGALLMELLTFLLRNSVQFRMIDVRLLYVVLFSTVYGLRVGSVASVFACASLAGAYFSHGINAVMLFYQPDNWLPFILFITAAAVCGLMHDRHEEEQQDLSGKVEELQKENDYTNQLYDEAIRYKREYKRNLIQSRDGFGRIFEAVQKLSVSEPTQVYGEAISVMEDILDNDSVAIYSIDEDNCTARLEVSSRKLTAVLQKTVRLKDYPDLVGILSENQVWINRDLRPDLPIYGAGIFAEEKLRLVVCLYEARYEQMTSYYENLIRVLCGLVRNFMLEAWSYQKATEERNHIGNTVLVTTDIFRNELQLRRGLANRGLASYSLIRIKGEGRSAEEIDALVKGKMREGDWITENKRDGNFYILAPQTVKKSGNILLKQIRELGLTCRLVENGTGGT